MLLYGASGHARVICSCLEAQGEKIIGIFDDDESLIHIDKYPIIGKYNPAIFLDTPIIISIGNNSTRKKISNLVNHEFGKINHPSAIIDPLTVISKGTVVVQGSIIQRGTVIGKHVIINTGATIDHDCIIEDFVHISPNATLCGNIRVGEGSQIGAGVVVKQGVSIGKWVIIGAGSVVIRSIPDFAVVVGNPSKIIKYND